MASNTVVEYARKAVESWPPRHEKIFSHDLPLQAAQLVHSLPYHIKTVLLFTKSDIKTIVLPISIFAISLASRTSPSALLLLSRVPSMLWWTWYTLLLFNIGNQTQSYSLSEDMMNKPWRPIPAGRITTENAKILESFLVVFVHCSSAVHGVLLPAVFLYLLGQFYNCYGGHRSAFGRNIICALAYAGFGYGASRLLEAGPAFALRATLSPFETEWVGLYSAIVFFTIQVADLGDIDGDLDQGRKTLPIVYGERPTKIVSAIGIAIGSELVRRFWDISGAAGACLLGGGALVCALVAWGEYHGPKNAYAWYCIWLMGLGLMPAFA